MNLEAKHRADTEQFVKGQCRAEPTGHDWWHIDRVRRMALFIGQSEGANLYLTEMAALLHDVDDHKFNPEGSNKAREWLTKLGEPEMEHILAIIDSVSYKGAGVVDAPWGIEGLCLQDADRLDAMGAIGIARAFAYGGHRGRVLYDPDMPPVMHLSFEAYRSSNGHTINHFHEKLLLLKDRMHTKWGRQMAIKRHQLMVDYLNEFMGEWQ